ncbi:PRC-barrel domain-containing protein [Bacillus carboniphilus]|uniref:PRC-barrel domain-containing protein n=1 Tax=Bacillus carboniphilus TaxID=86663 RepID=A0ABY9JXD5_9BACI|nr:PRC-barrel domain-containing protein [Bacillus carboniphilus]WLR44037.1 PRC-barrel domain-containing protein [Bacillus carboniphilus]
MRTFSSYIGLAAYVLVTGKLIGHVSDLALNKDGTLYGLLIDKKGFFERKRVVPLSFVHSVGEHGIMLIEDYSHPFSQEFFFHGHHPIHHRPIVSSNGNELGLVDDVYVSQDLGTILAYEVTNGLFADFTDGKKRLPFERLSIGEDTIVFHDLDK